MRVPLFVLAALTVFTVPLRAQFEDPPGGGSVSVTPDGGSATADEYTSANSVLFTVKNTGSSSDVFDLACTVTGQVTACSLSVETLSLAAGASGFVTAQYVTGAPGSGTIVLTVLGESFASDQGHYDVTVVQPPVYSVAVTPEEPSLDALSISATGALYYRVHNLGNQADTYILTCPVTGPLTCNWTNPSSLSLQPGQDSLVWASVSSSTTTGLATVTLRASGKDMGEATHDVTVYQPDAVSLAFTADQKLERSGCPTVGGGPNAMIQCGDLVYAHAVPGYRSLNRQRGLTLLYNSGVAFYRPVVAVDYTTFAGQQLPDLLRVQVIQVSNGISLADVYYSTAGFSSTQTEVHRMTTPIGIWTGAYLVDVIVGARVGGAWQNTTIRTRILSIAGTWSPFGVGWWPAGVERLFVQGDGLLLARGDGSPVFFEQQGAAFVAPPGEYSTITQVGTTYRRTLKGNRVSVWYRSNGLPDSIVDVHGNRATYTWVSGGVYGYKLTAITDPTGRAITFTYDGTGRVTAIGAPGAGTTTLYQKQDAAGSGWVLDSIRDPDGFVTRFTYYTWYRLKTSTARGTGTVTYTYDAIHRVDSVTAPQGVSAPAVQSRAWQLVGYGPASGTSATNPATPGRTDDAYVIVHQWRGSGQAVDTARFHVDRFQLPVAVDLPATATTQIYRDNVGQPVHIVRDGMDVWQEWDTNGNLLRGITRGVDPDARDTTRYTYHATWQRVTKIVPPARDSVLFGYDPGTGNRQWAKDAAGNQTTFTYNSRGQLKTIAEPGEAVPTTYTYNECGSCTYNLVAVADSAGSVTYVYDATYGSDLMTVRDALGTETRYTYDGVKRVRTVTQVGAGADPSTVEYQYDDVNRIRTQIDPLGRVSTWRHDAAGRLVERCVRPAWCETTAYDDGRNPTTIVQRDGSWIVQTFDGANRVVERRLGFYGQDDVIQFGYDGHGNLEYVFNRYARIHRVHDVYGRLVYEREEMRTWNDSTFWRGTEVRHAYDRNGRRKFTWVGEPVAWEMTCVPVPDQAPCDQDGERRPLFDDSLRYTYDNRGTLSQLRITHWAVTPGAGNDTWVFVHDAKGRLGETRYPLRSGGTARVYRNYDNDDRLWRQYSTGGAVGLDDRIVWDAVGNATRADLWYPNRYANYTYDGLGRLLTISGSHEWDTYTYDAAGNRLTSNSGSWTYNTKGQLTNSNAGSCATTYRYDTNGNQDDVDPSDACSATNWRSMEYDVGGRMTRMVTNKDGEGNEERLFWYDGLGRRILMRSNHGDAADYGVSRYFWFDDHVAVKTWNDTAAINVDLWWPQHYRNAANQLEGRGEWFFYAPGVDNLLASWNYIETETRHLFFRDWRGSVVQVTNEYGTGLGLSPDQYAAFGSAINAPAAGKNPGYNSHEDADGLVYMRNRWYDPNTGRFTQEDPIGYAGGINLYAYVGNNPILFSDPFGLAADTVEFADDDAQKMTEDCVKQSKVCAELFNALQSHESKWVIRTGNLTSPNPGETNTSAVSNQVFGGRITIDPSNIGAAQNLLNVAVNTTTVVTHELGHAVGNISIANMGSLSQTNNCDERCAIAAENAARGILGMALRR